MTGKLKKSAAMKLLAVILAALALTLAIVSAVFIAFMAGTDCYVEPPETVRENIRYIYVSDMVYNIYCTAQSYYSDNRWDDIVSPEQLLYSDVISDFAFEIEIDGKTMFDFSDFDGADKADYSLVTRYEREFSMDTYHRDDGAHNDKKPTYGEDAAETTSFVETLDLEKQPAADETDDITMPVAGVSSNRDAAEATEPVETEPVEVETDRDKTWGSDEIPAIGETKNMTISFFIKKGSNSFSNLNSVLSLGEHLYKMRYSMIVIAAVSAILFIVCFAFALLSAGHRQAVDGISLSAFDRAPLDLLLSVTAAAAMLEITALSSLIVNMSGIYFPTLLAMPASLVTAVCTVIIITVFIDAVWLMLISMTTAARVKARKLLTYNVITYALRFTLGLASKLYVRASRIAAAIPVVWRTLIFGLLALIISILLYGVPFLAVIFWVALVAVACYRAWCMNILRRAGKKLASGELSYRLDGKGLYGDYKLHADDLNNIGRGMEAAVEERLKSERFRAELITNVSHDIKTPLTSIINYVDLLKSPDLDEATARSYIEVLDRQSQKLRRLTEDLIEASKASSGVIPVDLQPCDLSVVITQAAGEYSERLEAAGLTLIVKGADTPVTVMADGRHTARIIDNLVSNAVKYSLPGTRVYLELIRRDGFAGISVTNVSRDPLNVDSHELTERFVRGDASRHTEGSGLGLSIAESLAELQGGALALETNADLFRATLWFPTAK